MKERNQYPVLILAVAAGTLFLSALFLVFFVSMRRDSNEELCRANLTIIGIAIRGGELPSSPKWDAVGRGRAFFMDQPKWPSYQPREIDPFCPVKATRKDIDYRGPSKPLREIGNDEPIVADRVGNHGPGKGGNVLLKTGAVHTVPENHALWATASRTTSD